MRSLVFDAGLRQRLTAHLDGFAHLELPAEGRKLAAVALTVISDEDGGPALILTKRAARLSSHAGQWALPGGRLDAGEAPEDGALRELREEIGLDLTRGAVLGRLDDYPTRSGYVVTPVVLWGGERPRLTANAAEVAQIHRVPFAELDREDSPEFVSIPESDRPVVRILVFEHQIYAPTAAMVYQFREVAVKGNPIRVHGLDQPVWAWR